APARGSRDRCAEPPPHHVGVDEAEPRVPEHAGQGRDDREAERLPQPHRPGVGRDDQVEPHRGEAERLGPRERVLAHPPAQAPPARRRRDHVRRGRDVRAAAARVPAALRGRRVYFEVDATPYAAGAGSFIGELLARMGLANAVPAALGPFPKLNPEYVVHLQPDVVMASAQDLATMPGRPGWGALNALRDGRTCGYTSAQFELLTRSGPRLGEAASMLADCLVSIGAKPAGSSIAAYPAASKGR
ncbi:MAG: ABC transporter substrate-binding protein, partial [Burkholderiales bacterium]|nr:ABC transporter substrate-binding protein [Burkholderiales bacterium]